MTCLFGEQSTRSKCFPLAARMTSRPRSESASMTSLPAAATCSPPATTSSGRCPPQNVIAMIEASAKYGRYPLELGV